MAARRVWAAGLKTWLGVGFQPTWALLTGSIRQSAESVGLYKFTDHGVGSKPLLPEANLHPLLPEANLHLCGAFRHLRSFRKLLKPLCLL